MSLITVDLQKNPKQGEYFYKVLESCAGKNGIRFFNYGGAVRGGKTFITLAIFAVLSKMFPGSRWHVVRKDMPVLRSTTIPSFEKIIRGSKDWKVNRNPSDYHYTHTNGSKIFFMPENISRDPNLNDFLGLETNGIFMEQVGELSEKLWEKALERTGSWYIDRMPPGFIFTTFNPTQSWIKEKVYDPWLKGELKEPFYFMQAFPNDNAFVTKDQWNAWKNMADRYQKQFIGGDWTDFDDNENDRWAFAFNRKKHVGKTQAKRSQTLWLAFDFNKNPITCQVLQHYNGWVYGIYSIKLPNSDIYKLCDKIKMLFPNFLYMVTGDSTGNNTTAMVKDNLNYYKIIQSELNLNDGQFKVPSVNPSLIDNRVLVNSLLSNYNVILDEHNCKDLIFDLTWVKVSPDKKIDKSSRTDVKKQADSLDGFRYFCNMELGWFIDMI